MAPRLAKGAYAALATLGHTSTQKQGVTLGRLRFAHLQRAAKALASGAAQTPRPRLGPTQAPPQAPTRGVRPAARHRRAPLREADASPTRTLEGDVVTA